MYGEHTYCAVSCVKAQYMDYVQYIIIMVVNNVTVLCIYHTVLLIIIAEYTPYHKKKVYHKTE